MSLLHLCKFFLGSETGCASIGPSLAKRLELNSKYSEFCLELSRHQHCLCEHREAKNKDNRERWYKGAELHLQKANRIRAELIPLIDWFEESGEPIPISECIESVPREDFKMPEKRRSLWPF